MLFEVNRSSWECELEHIFGEQFGNLGRLKMFPPYISMILLKNLSREHEEAHYSTVCSGSKESI